MKKSNIKQATNRSVRSYFLADYSEDDLSGILRLHTAWTPYRLWVALHTIAYEPSVGIQGAVQSGATHILAWSLRPHLEIGTRLNVTPLRSI